MSRINSQYAYFHVRGEFDPAELTRSLSLDPSKCWKKGDAWKPDRDRNFSYWALHSRLAQTESIEQHVRDVIAQLNSREAAFKALTQNHVCWMEIVGYFWDRYPGLVFERDIIAGLAKYNLAVDFDFYGPEPDAGR